MCDVMWVGGRWLAVEGGREGGREDGRMEGRRRVGVIICSHHIYFPLVRYA